MKNIEISILGAFDYFLVKTILVLIVQYSINTKGKAR